MTSPILAYETAIAGCAFAVAPERQEELARLRDRYKIVLQPVDKDHLIFGIRADPLTGIVTLPTSALEYLWACAHFFWVIYQENINAQRAGLTQLNFKTNARLWQGLSLVNWARRNMVGKADPEWPTDLPSPAACEKNEDATVANELFLAALAWIIHHEIAHVTLGHPPYSSTSFSVAQEREADRTATKWVLEGLERDAPALLKRALGVATAVLTLQSLEVAGRVNDGRTHPPAQQRLDSCLGDREVGTDEKVQAFCVGALQFLFGQDEISAKVDGNSFGEILADLLVDKSRKGH